MKKTRIAFLFALSLSLFACNKKSDKAKTTTEKTTTRIITTENQVYHDAYFYNYDSTLLKTVKTLDGSTPVYDGEIPKKSCELLGCQAKFVGWTPSLSPINGDKSYYATFDGYEPLSEMSNFIFESTETTCIITGIKNKTIKEIIVPDYVTEISLGAFSGCYNVETIQLPFVGDKMHEADDLYQYTLGYIFGKEKYNYASETEQYYYADSTTTMSKETYYIPYSLENVIVTKSNIIPCGSFYNCYSLK